MGVESPVLPFSFLKDTIMYRLQDIQEALQNVVGWEADYRANLTQGNTESESGMYFQQAHPLLTLNNIRAIMPDDWDTQYPSWKQDKIYNEGDKVRDGGKVYVATRTHVNYKPSMYPDYWAEYDTINDYLPLLVRRGVSKMVQTFVQQKQLQRESKDLLEHRTFFDGAGRLSATIMGTHKVVGFEIVPLRSFGVTTKVERIGLQMTGATGMVTMFLFHSSQYEPIGVYELNFTKENGGFQWFNIDNCYLPYRGDNTNDGGAWYLCYYQDSLPLGMEAIQMTKDWSKEPCTTCGIRDLRAWRELTKHIQISPFCANVSEGWGDNPMLWDIAQNIYTSTTNYGLNCEVTIGCDLTDFIVSQRQIFATCLQRQVAFDALRTLALNPDVRVNRNQSNAERQDILYELDGNTQGRRGGLGYDLEKAYDALRIDTKGMDRVCLACNNYGVQYTTC